MRILLAERVLLLDIALYCVLFNVGVVESASKAAPHASQVEV